MGTGYIHSSEYEAWARLNRVRISMSELAILKAIDRAFVHYTATKDDPPPSQEPGGFIKQLSELAPEKVQKKAK